MRILRKVAAAFFLFCSLSSGFSKDNDASSSGGLSNKVQEALELVRQYNRVVKDLDKYWEEEIRDGLQTGKYTQDESDSDYQRIRAVFDKLKTSDQLKGRYNWRIYLQNTSEVNAFAAVNGIIIINKGIADYCKNDDELAVVIGHGMVHITKNHLKKQIASTFIKDALVQRMSELAAKEISDKKMFEMIFGLAGNLALLKFSRMQEEEADKFGAMYAASVGYNAAAGYELWMRLANDFRSSPLNFLSTHPTSEERAKRFKNGDY
ncbi:MAG: M48 family metallopeptidase [Treponematales bacterium]